MFPFRNSWMLFVCIAFVAGCAGRYDNITVTGGRTLHGKTLAVMPFQGTAEASGSGLIIADTFAGQLHAQGYSVLAPEVVAQRLANHEGEALSPQEVGRVVVAPYILTGRVTEYTYKSGVGENPAIGINVRLIDTATGNVLWSAMSARTGSGNWFREDSLSRLAAEICQTLAESLNGFFEQSGSSE